MKPPEAPEECVTQTITRETGSESECGPPRFYWYVAEKRHPVCALCHFTWQGMAKANPFILPEKIERIPHVYPVSRETGSETEGSSSDQQ